jgi:hypothetical protein
MRDLKPDDLVLHLLHDAWAPGEREHRFVGRSFAASPVESRPDGPPIPGEWAGQAPFYQVALRDYEAFPEPISLEAFIPLFEDELRDELSHQPKYFPFINYSNDIRLRQGGYINECTPILFDAVKRSVLDIPPAPGAAKSTGTHGASADRQFKETKRLASERYAFARNPGLVRDARALRGFECEACDFDFEAKYGELGREYIECHHVDPLGKRDNPSTSTSVRDVRMLCANCHRMVHRSRPILPVEELRASLGLAPRPPIPSVD